MIATRPYLKSLLYMFLGTKRQSCITNFIGFSWDLPGKIISLPTEKSLKFHDWVCIFLVQFTGHRCSLFDVQKIHVLLSHIALVLIQGHSHLSSLLNFISSFDDNEYTVAIRQIKKKNLGSKKKIRCGLWLTNWFHYYRFCRYPAHSMITDLKWWLCMLNDPRSYQKLLPWTPCQDMGIFVDVSTSWGSGIVISGKWTVEWASVRWARSRAGHALRQHKESACRRWCTVSVYLQTSLC